MIYLIQQGEDGPIKIGFTRDRLCLRRRLSSLRTGHAHELHLRAVVPGDRSDEELLHKFFEADRMRGEWFQPSPLLLRAADSDATFANVLDQVQSWNRFRGDGLVGFNGCLTAGGLIYVMELERRLLTEGFEIDEYGKACVAYAQEDGHLT